MKKLIVFITIFSLTVFFSGLQPVKAKSNIKQKILIHYANPGKPGAPTGCTATTNDAINDFSAAGWHMPSQGMIYQINYSTKTAGLSNSQIDSAISSAFGTWESADSKQIFYNGGKTAVKNFQLDSTNAIFWFPMSTSIIAQASIMFDGSTGEVVEIDTAFNKNYKWSVNSPTLGDCGGPTSSYDLQNIATHEFGHWVGLLDLYSPTDTDLTMYGYGSRSELKKDSLGTGDTTGVQTIVP